MCIDIKIEVEISCRADKTKEKLQRAKTGAFRSQTALNFANAISTDILRWCVGPV